MLCLSRIFPLVPCFTSQGDNEEQEVLEVIEKICSQPDEEPCQDATAAQHIARDVSAVAATPE